MSTVTTVMPRVLSDLPEDVPFRVGLDPVKVGYPGRFSRDNTIIGRVVAIAREYKGPRCLLFELDHASSDVPWITRSYDEHIANIKLSLRRYGHNSVYKQISDDAGVIARASGSEFSIPTGHRAAAWGNLKWIKPDDIIRIIDGVDETPEETEKNTTLLDESVPVSKERFREIIQKNFLEYSECVPEKDMSAIDMSRRFDEVHIVAYLLGMDEFEDIFMEVRDKMAGYVDAMYTRGAGKSHGIELFTVDTSEKLVKSIWMNNNKDRLVVHPDLEPVVRKTLVGDHHIFFKVKEDKRKKE